MGIHKGKTTILRCTMCHEVNGVGANFGPRLEGWAAKQSASAIIHAIVNHPRESLMAFREPNIFLKIVKSYME